MLRVITWGLVAFWLTVSAAFAQDDLADSYKEWTDLASRAESVLVDGEASSEALEELRSNIATFRDKFLEAQEINADRIATLQAQIDALGPVPEEGATEPEEIAQRRAELNDQLAALRAPVVQAEEAFTRANGLINEIDTTIRERQTDQLFRLGPSPLNPAHWVSALGDLATSLEATGDEITRNLSSPTRLADLRAQLPAVILFVLIGLVLIILSQRWMRRFVEYMRNHTRAGTGVWSFVLSLGRIVIGVVGFALITYGLSLSQVVGPRLELLLFGMPVWVGILLAIRWLAEQSFHPRDDIATLPLDAKDRRRARRIANTLAVVLVLESILDTLVSFDDFSEATRAVIDFPILVLAGLLLYRLGRVRNSAAAGVLLDNEHTEDEGLFRLRIARVFGRVAMIIGVAGPVLAAIGFNGIGEAMTFPAIETLAVVALILVLQRLINDIYELVTGKNAEEANSLLTVFAGFFIILGALPVIALIWGARVADLTELWSRFQNGFMIGDTRFQPSDLLVIIIVFFLGYMLTRLMQGGLRTAVLPKTKIDQGGQNAIVAGLGYVGVALAAIIAITAAGIDLTSLAFIAGALSLGIGFGLQNIVQNFVSGIILLIERPIGEGDWIEVGGQHGTVKSISVRSTRIETFDKFDVIVPNADLVSGQVRNYTRGNLLGRIIVPVGVAYGTDTRKVEKILLDIARHHDMVLMNPAPYVYFAGFGADSLDFEIRAVLRDVTAGLGVRTEMRHQIVEKFAEEGIEIPFAQRDIWLRNPEALHAAPSAPTPPPTETDSEPRDRTPNVANIRAQRGGDEEGQEDVV
ncbi:DUF3772 domain-containing protein [Cognatishimia sp. F0-27]|uniref:DUF3772 domain-containing protein n=1 Tax=Cognatishimia sp. F0-27 TaxID=2816855 RepID=UPI001D0C2379|nr:DUF3772 domain-containing protein [Cognatishimia sp. F0-27]MCC1492282.1 DUF3772 domain-containing protein [Cognatishimia sp. F0-27]